MKRLKIVLKLMGLIILIPIGYLLIAFITSYITVNNNNLNCNNSKKVYLSTNGVHLDLVIPVKYLSKELKNGIKIKPLDKYLAFGWGDANFYLKTPTWNELKFSTAFEALFLKSETLIHITNYKYKYSGWKEVVLCDDQLKIINEYINNSFKLNDGNHKILLVNQGYGYNDEFYNAIGSYSCFHTCNSWVNNALKVSNLKACLWTPFDFILLNKYK